MQLDDSIQVNDAPPIEDSEAIAPEPGDEKQTPILASLLALRLPVSVSIGQSELEMKNVLLTGLGSLIPINKEVSEAVELLVHGRVVARGEIVEVKGNYGFRVKHIVSRQELLELWSS
jgi:flagellar motor switch/type III secretory pathway protein FliN